MLGLFLSLRRSHQTEEAIFLECYILEAGPYKYGPLSASGTLPIPYFILLGARDEDGTYCKAQHKVRTQKSAHLTCFPVIELSLRFVD